MTTQIEQIYIVEHLHVRKCVRACENVYRSTKRAKKASCAYPCQQNLF